MDLRRLAAVLSILAAGPWTAASSTEVRLALDINQTVPQGSTATADSDPADFVDFDGRLFFTADDGVHGRELWQSDSTAAGTKLVADLVAGAPGSNPNHPFTANNTLYFFAADAQGVSHLMALAPGRTTPVVLAQLEANQCTRAVVLNGKLLFVAVANSNAVSQLWTSNGTAAGTTRIDNAASASSLAPCNLGIIGNKLYFVGRRADLPNSLQQAIWSSDGTWNGTNLFLSSVSSGAGDSYGFADGVLYFNDADPSRFGGVYRTDGTAGGTEQILFSSEPRPFGNHQVSLIGILNGQLIYRNVSVNNLQIPSVVTVDLGTTNGLLGGSTSIASFRFGDPMLMSTSQIFFVGQDAAGREPWVTDGTSGGTRLVRDISQGGDSTINWFGDYHGSWLIRLVDPNVGPQLWQTDTTNDGTRLVANVPAEPPLKFTNNVGVTYRPDHGLGGADFFFVGSDAQVGNELYVLADDAPLAVADAGDARDGATIEVSVLTNDDDPDGNLDSTTVRIATAPLHGTATPRSTGVVTYTPTVGYSGNDSFSYTVADNLGKPSAPAQVNLTVTAAPGTTPPANGSGSGGGGGGAIRMQDLFLLLAMLIALRVHSFHSNSSSCSSRAGQP